VPFVVHEHVPTRTNEEAERNLSYAVERIVMIVDRTSGKDIVQAALRVTEGSIITVRREKPVLRGVRSIYP
jgi:hypothetical protein